MVRRPTADRQIPSSNLGQSFWNGSPFWIGLLDRLWDRVGFIVVEFIVIALFAVFIVVVFIVVVFIVIALIAPFRRRRRRVRRCFR